MNAQKRKDKHKRFGPNDTEELVAKRLRSLWWSYSNSWYFASQTTGRRTMEIFKRIHCEEIHAKFIREW
jgi:hypothetical protein